MVRILEIERVEGDNENWSTAVHSGLTTGRLKTSLLYRMSFQAGNKWLDAVRTAVATAAA